jgi:hypothetical protein
MGTDRRTALTTGVLFIVATAASLLGTAVEPSGLNGASVGSLADAAARVSAGGLLELIAAATSVGIAISLYPVLSRWNAGLALGSVVFRAIEAGMYTVGAVSLLALLGVRSTPGDSSGLVAVGNALVALRQEAVLAGVFAFSVGALMYYWIFYRSNLIPRWLSAWGLAAALMIFAACVAATFSRAAIQTYVMLVLPIAVQEMVFAVWLIARGFSPEALRSDPGLRRAA